MTRTTPLAVAAVTSALTASLLLAGCSEDHHPVVDPGTGTITRGVDARSYVDDYQSPTYDQDGAGAVAMPSAVNGSAPEDRGGEVPGLLEDNTFEDAGTGGFVDTAADARSTFALDVDTGSFGVARTLLDQGQQVPAASVRVEEWVNAMPYGDAPPTDADLAVTAESGLAPSLDDGTQLVRVAVTAREVDAAERPPVNVTLVVDRSGSMDIRERLGLVQSSLAVLADRLRDDDTVSVVSFEDRARPILEPTRVSDTDAILDAVDELRPGGSTNLAAGLRLGYRMARESYREGANNLVVLASDGVANVGPTGPGSITEMIREQGAEGIHLVTVGFGMGNYNDHLMEQLADLGDGFYSYVDDFDEAERLFGDDLTTTLTPVAEEARSQVTFDPAAVSSYRLVGYDNRAIDDGDFEDLTVDAGELGAGHHATALYEVRLADGVRPGDEIGTAAVRWADVDGGRARDATAPLLAADPDQPSPSASFALAAATADLAQLVKGAAPYDDRGLTLAGLRARVQGLADAGVPGARALLRLTTEA